MSIEDTIAVAKDLIKKREDIDRQLEALFSGAPQKTRATQKCSKCNKEGHSARTCTETSEHVV